MSAILWLVPAALALGFCGLIAFFWSMKSGQFDDPKGDASRILMSEDRPIVDEDEPDKDEEVNS